MRVKGRRKEKEEGKQKGGIETERRERERHGGKVREIRRWGK